ncbi:MAG: hydroxymethylbilane synthase [Candidatus Eisenbacteria bacterium]|uniref:Hydroxymethylbilane synthase n=1 Tax=Eiseniibacteriota bacterium TaxID=2212470 RepID=A0A538SIE1_UNCEI|nr:MAG: hydroxymethylbilane synthase [Candidatus Eisenbacteria bacterium]TMQ55546.1 MAG: hydroxymethylbilane synthase [Candidatus Eisenbacteria bacterium]
MTKHKIKIGFRDHRLGRILGEQAIELLKPHLSSAAFALVPVGVPRGRGHAAVWPGQPVEQALLRGEVDLAVQNMKDLSPEPPAGIVLAAVTERFTPFDVLIARDGTIVDDLPEGSAVSAHTPIRRAQLLHYRDDLSILDFSGSLEERMRKLELGEVDGLVVSASAVEHLGYQDRVTEVFTTEVVVPAPGQGALGIQVLKSAKDLLKAARHLDDPIARVEIDAERAFQREITSDPTVPIGALAKLDGASLRLEGVIADREGLKIYRDEEEGKAGDEEQIGVRLARRLLLDGARALLTPAESSH